MANVFSVTIFFIVFRAVIEVSLIVAILLSFIQQFLHKAPALDFESNPTTVSPRALRRLRLQVCIPLHHLHLSPTCFPGHFRYIGWLVYCPCHWRCVHRCLVHTGNRPLVKHSGIMGRHASFAISRHNNTDPLLGVVQLFASLLVFVVGVAMLRAENAREDWRLKVQNAFDGHRTFILDLLDVSLTSCCRTRLWRNDQQVGPLHPPLYHSSPRR